MALAKILDRALIGLFLTTIALVPVQLGRHFWPDYAAIFGVRHDLLSPILYLSDIVILVLLIVWSFKLIVAPEKIELKAILVLALLPASFLISSIFSANFAISAYKTAKTFEFALLALYFSQAPINKFKGVFITVLTFSLFWVSLLTFSQFISQRSFDLWLIGERHFSAVTPGIAQVTLSGQQLLRPYASFPHPNVLAGYLVISLLPIAAYLYQLQSGGRKFLLITIAVFGLFALLLTFSRSGWLALLTACLIIFIPLLKKAKLGRNFREIFNTSPVTFLFFAVAFGLIAWLSLGLVSQRFLAVFTTDAHSFALRQKLIVSSFEMFWHSPTVGVGPGRFLLELPNFFQVQEVIRFFQPVHNIYFLLLAENGILGVLVLVVTQTFLFFSAAKKSSIGKLVAFAQLVAVLIIGNLDHYFFSLQQGQLLFWLVAGFALQKH